MRERTLEETKDDIKKAKRLKMQTGHEDLEFHGMSEQDQQLSHDCETGALDKRLGSCKDTKTKQAQYKI